MINKNFIGEMNRLFYYLICHQGSTISGISAATGIPCANVMKILMHFHRSPFGGIMVYFKGYSDYIDIEKTGTDIAYNIPEWHIDTSRMDKIPVESLDKTETLLLECILKSLKKSINDRAAGNADSDADAHEGFFVKQLAVDAGWFQGCVHREKLVKGITEKRCMEMEYIKGEQRFEFVLKPLGIVLYTPGNLWYLVAQDENDSIFPYRIDRIASVEVKDRTFTIPEGFDLHAFSGGAWGMETGNREFVRILFKNEGNVVTRARRRLNGKGTIDCMDGGSILFYGEIEGINSFKSWLRGFGSSAYVIEPAWLREDIIESFRKICRNYENMDRYLEMISET